MLNLQSWFVPVKNSSCMAKLSIPVSSRDLRDAVQSSLALVPAAKVPGLLRALEKIAGRVSGAGSYEIGIATMRHVQGRWEVQPRLEDLYRDGVVVSVLHGSDKKVLMAVHSSLFGQLFNSNDQPAQKDPYRYSSAQKKPGEPGTLTASGVQEKRNCAAESGRKGSGVGPDFPTRQSLSKDFTVAEQRLQDSESGPTGNQMKAIAISEKQLFLAIKNSLDGLEFGDLLALNRGVLDVMDALKSGTSLPAMKCTKRLVGLGDTLSFEIENDERTPAVLVRGLLAGLGLNSLIQLHGEFSTRLNIAHAGPRKGAANAIKTS